MMLLTSAALLSTSCGAATVIRDVGPIAIDPTEVSSESMFSCYDSGTCTSSDVGDCQATGDPQLPARCVPQSAAQQYCKLLGRRLPTQAEWLAAANADKGGYPWGDGSAPGEVCARGTSAPCAPGSSAGDVTPSGIHDLDANVREWTSSSFERDGQRFVVFCGASFKDKAVLRLDESTSCGALPERDVADDIGFRCVTSP